MKRNIFLTLTIALVAIIFASCGAGAPKAKSVKLNNELDSINYMYGLFNGNRIKAMFEADSDFDAKKINEYVEGVVKGLNAKTSDDNKEVVQLGGNIGAWIKQQETNGFLGDSTLKLNYSLFRQGFVNSSKNDKMMMGVEEAEAYINRVMEARQEKMMAEQYKEEKIAGEAFIAESKSIEGIQETASGLLYVVERDANGAKPTATDVVKVHYKGTLMDGTEFDSSYERSEPTEFVVNQVIPGWIEGLQLMPVGSKYKFYIPQNLAYGARGSHGSIPPFSPLVFEVELLEIVSQ